MWKPRFLVAVLSALSVGSCLWADTGTSGHHAARITRVEHGLSPWLQIEDGPVWSLEERMAHYGVPGVSIAVIEDFDVAWAKGYGVRSANGSASVDSGTLFQAASISKPVSAAAALRLVQDGLLDLDEDVNRRLTSWKVPESQFTHVEKVTLRRLLSHSAGLTVSGFSGYPFGEPVPTLLQVLDGEGPANSAPIRVDMVPGSGFRYSGGGYTVLQILLEDVTGQRVSELIEELILVPTKMQHSSFRNPLPPDLDQRTSYGHGGFDGPIRGRQFVRGGSMCCALWTTPTDLGRFAAAIAKAARGEKNAILHQELAQAMIIPSVEGRMGLGFGIENRWGTAYFRHGGGNPGFASYLVLQPDEGYGAAIMINSENGEPMIRELLASIAREYSWEGYLDPGYASLEDMLSDLRRLHKDNPTNPRVAETTLKSLGSTLPHRGLADWSVRVFMLNVELHPKSASAYDGLGDGQGAAGDLRGAERSYRRALGILEQRGAQSEEIESKLRDVTHKREGE